MQIKQLVKSESEFWRMKTMNEKLKPCPFCGVPYPYITFERGYLDDSAVVFCNACKISVKLEENDQEGYNDVTKRKAIEAWNRRVNNE